MYSKTVSIIIIFSISTLCEASYENSIEARGKKKKIALLVWIADLIIKKFFILKLIYAFILFIIIHKAGYFLSWFISYLKEQKQEYHHGHHDHHPHVEYGHHYDYGPPHHSYGPPQYGPSSYSNGPYKREAWLNRNDNA